MWSRRLYVAMQFHNSFSNCCNYLLLFTYFISKHSRSKKLTYNLCDRLCTLQVINICYIISVAVHFMWPWLSLLFCTRPWLFIHFCEWLHWMHLVGCRCCCSLHVKLGFYFAVSIQISPFSAAFYFLLLKSSLNSSLIKNNLSS